MTQRPLVLYSTDACSACEKAMDLLLSLPALRGMSLVVVDVAESADLVERYGSRVPVLETNGRTLGWPFDAEAVNHLLADRLPG